MKKLNSKYFIKIPKTVNILYCDEKNVLVLFTKTNKKAVWSLKTKLFILQNPNVIKVTQNPYSNNISNKIKKNLKALRGTVTKTIRQNLINLCFSNQHKKLELIGVGYKVFNVLQNNSSFLKFKLGYSHDIYFKMPTDLKIVCKKANQIYILGSSFEEICKLAVVIRNYRSPEPYKGKGVRYKNEIIKLKQGKKI